MSRYGKRFDDLARRWRVIEDEHDRQHPDRSECGGVGGCSMMGAKVNLQHEMIDALHEWRRKSGQEGSKGSAEEPVAEDPAVFTDGMGDRWHLSDDGLYRMDGNAKGAGWTIAEIREQYGAHEEPAKCPETFTDGDGDTWNLGDDGLYRLLGRRDDSTGWTLSAIRNHFGGFREEG